MAQVKWTRQAVDDLDGIAEFIALDSENYANLFVTHVRNAVARAGQFPASGRLVPEAQNESLREILLGNYRIIYRIHDTCVEILAIYHSSRLLDPRQL